VGDGQRIEIGCAGYAGAAGICIACAVFYPNSEVWGSSFRQSPASAERRRKDDYPPRVLVGQKDWSARPGLQRAPLLKVEHVTKNFPGVRALDDVSIAFEAGSVHALVRENGAGKSTLGNIIAGIYTPDAGIIRIEGKEVRPTDPLSAKRLGIAIVHQELDFCPNLPLRQAQKQHGPESGKSLHLDWPERSALIFDHQVCNDPRSLLKTRMSRINREVIL
jgi:hypothetical protein